MINPLRGHQAKDEKATVDGRLTFIGNRFCLADLETNGIKRFKPQRAIPLKLRAP